MAQSNTNTDSTDAILAELEKLLTKQGMEEYIKKKTSSHFTLKCKMDTFDPQCVTANAIFTDEISIEALFPSGDAYKKLVGGIKKLTRAGIISLWVFLLLHLVEKFSWIVRDFEKLSTSWDKDAFVEKMAKYYSVPILSMSRTIMTGSFDELTAAIDHKAKEFTQVSLVKLLEDSATKERLLRACSNNLLKQDTYLSNSDKWTSIASLPDFWLIDGNLKLTRDGLDVLKYLYPTQTVMQALNYKSFDSPIILSGESGGGKTCTLLVVGGKHDVNIATQATSAVEKFVVLDGDDKKQKNEDKMVEYIDNYVTTMLQPMLAQFNNPDEVLTVMLHLDEVDATCHEKMRTLIHAADRLHSPHMAPKCNIKLSIRIAMAGTGLSHLLNCTPGSLSGKFHILAVQPPTLKELREIVTLHVGKETVDAVMMQREFKNIVATNMRLLSFTLRALLEVLRFPSAKDVPPQKDPNHSKLIDDIKNHIRGSDVPPLECFPDDLASVGCALRYACTAGAIRFVNANGLSFLPRELRLELLHIAHKAYLERVVLYDGDDVMRRSLESAGFTPLRREAVLEQDAGRRVVVEVLRMAEKNGVFTTTEQEQTISTKGEGEDEVRWLPTTKPNKEGVVMAVPDGRSPIQMSAAYRMLPRMLSGTLFSKGSPQDFEDLLTELSYEGLFALRGGCSYTALVAAVCGPEYALAMERTALETESEEEVNMETVNISALATVLSDALREELTPDMVNDLQASLVEAEGAVKNLLRHGKRSSDDLEHELEERLSKRRRIEQSNQPSQPPGTPVDYMSALSQIGTTTIGTTLEKYRLRQLVKMTIHTLDDVCKGRLKLRGVGPIINEGNKLREDRALPHKRRTSINREPRHFIYTHVVKVVLDFTLQKDSDCYVPVAMACVRALQEQYPGTFDNQLKRAGMTLEGVLGLVAEIHAANEEKPDLAVSAFVEGILRSLLMNKMFVLVPAERSPSADAIIMCVSEHTPYLAGLQYKRYTSRPVTHSVFEGEIGKMSKKCLSMQSLMRLSGAEAVECFFGLYQHQAYMPTGSLHEQTVHTFVRNEVGNFFKFTTEKIKQDKI